jgi:hypothetical protein
MDTHSSPNAHERVLDDRDLDYWGMILDLIPPVLQAWKLILPATIAAGAIAYFISVSNDPQLSKNYSSVAYIGPLGEEKARLAESILRSGPILKSALEKFPDYAEREVPDRNRRELLAKSIHFFPASGADPKRPSLYVLEVSDTDPDRAEALGSTLIDAWLATTKPRPVAAARLSRLLEAAKTQISDLSIYINELSKRSELIVPKPGYSSPDVATLITLRAESIDKAEDIKSELAGTSRDIIFSPPTKPDKSVPDVPKRSPWRTVFKAMGGTFVMLVVIIVLRRILVASMSSPLYGARMQRIRDALPWRTARTDVL